MVPVEPRAGDADLGLPAGEVLSLQGTELLTVIGPAIYLV